MEKQFSAMADNIKLTPNGHADPPAGVRLTGTFELLEKILHAFTLRNLLLAGHVDQDFSTAI